MAEVTTVETIDPVRDLLRFHRRIRLSLQTFLQLAEAAVAGAAPSPMELRALVDFFTGPLMWHDIDEEVTLLPRLRRKAQPDLLLTLDQLTDQHAQMEERLERLLPHLSDVASGRAVVDAHLLLDEARALDALLQEHLSLEEQTVFLVAKDLLDATDIAEMRTELAHRLHERKTHQVRAVPLDADTPVTSSTPDQTAVVDTRTVQDAPAAALGSNAAVEGP